MKWWWYAINYSPGSQFLWYFSAISANYPCFSGLTVHSGKSDFCTFQPLKNIEKGVAFNLKKLTFVISRSFKVVVVGNIDIWTFNSFVVSTA